MRNLLWQMAERNKAENREGSIEAIKRNIRAGLQAAEPNLTDAQIEARVEQRMQRGMRRTTAVLPEKPDMAAIVAARRKAGRARPHHR